MNYHSFNWSGLGINYWGLTELNAYILNCQILGSCQSAYLSQETGDMKRQMRLAFRKHLDILSPLTPDRDELSMALRKEREMPPLCLTTSLIRSEGALEGGCLLGRQRTIGFLHWKLTSPPQPLVTQTISSPSCTSGNKTAPTPVWNVLVFTRYSRLNGRGSGPLLSLRDKEPVLARLEPTCATLFNSRTAKLRKHLWGSESAFFF